MCVALLAINFLDIFANWVTIMVIDTLELMNTLSLITSPQASAGR